MMLEGVDLVNQVLVYIGSRVCWCLDLLIGSCCSSFSIQLGVHLSLVLLLRVSKR